MSLLLSLLFAADPLVVANVEAKGEIDPAVSAALEEVVASEAALVSGMNVVSPASVRAALSLQERQQLAGCSEAQCFKQVTAMLQARELLALSLQRLPSGFTLTIERFDLKENRSLRRSTQTSGPTAEALFAVARSQTAALFGVAARIALWNQPRDAEVYVDGRLVGATPVREIPLEQPGKHVVSLRGPSVTAWRTEVDVAPGSELRLRSQSRAFVELEREAYARRNAGIGLLAGAAATAAGAATLWATAVLNDRTLDRLDLRVATQPELDAITSRTLGLTVGAVAVSALTGALLGVALWLLFDNPERRTLLDNGVVLW